MSLPTQTTPGSCDTHFPKQWMQHELPNQGPGGSSSCWSHSPTFRVKNIRFPTRSQVSPGSQEQNRSTGARAGSGSSCRAPPSRRGRSPARLSSSGMHMLEQSAGKGWKGSRAGEGVGHARLPSPGAAVPRAPAIRRCRDCPHTSRHRDLPPGIPHTPGESLGGKAPFGKQSLLVTGIPFPGGSWHLVPVAQGPTCAV